MVTDGLSWLSTTFSLCSPLSNIIQLGQWLYDIWFELAESRTVLHLFIVFLLFFIILTANYPYPTDFLEPLPAWPLNVC